MGRGLSNPNLENFEYKGEGGEWRRQTYHYPNDGELARYRESKKGGREEEEGEIEDIGRDGNRSEEWRKLKSQSWAACEFC